MLEDLQWVLKPRLHGRISEKSVKEICKTIHDVLAAAEAENGATEEQACLPMKTKR